MSSQMVHDAEAAATIMKENASRSPPRDGVNSPSGRRSQSPDGKAMGAERPDSPGKRLLGRGSPPSPDSRATSPTNTPFPSLAMDTLPGAPKGRFSGRQSEVSDEGTPPNLFFEGRPKGFAAPATPNDSGTKEGLWSDAQAHVKKDELSETSSSKKLPTKGDDRIVRPSPAGSAGDGPDSEKGDKAGLRSRIEARMSLAKESGVAKAKVVAYVARKMGDSREVKKDAKMLDYYMEGLKAEEWMKRKIAIDESMDLILSYVAQAKAAQQISVIDEQYAIVESKILPILSDMNWRVRKSVVRGLNQLAKLEARKVKSMLLPYITNAPTYVGRWSSAKLAMSISSPSEEQFRKRITEAMTKALGDEHWIVRQEALDALPQLVQLNDPAIICRGLELLHSDSASLRRTGVEVLGKFANENARHDTLNDVQLAKRLLRTGLIGKNAFDSCDVNGNGLLSVRELRTALRKKYDIEVSLKRMVVFAKDFHDKDMTFFNFMDLVKSHMQPTEVADRENVKEKVNKKRLAQALLEEIIETLPVDYSPATMTLHTLKAKLETETDWMTKDKLMGMCFSMSPMFDKDVPILIQRGLSTFNAKLCLASSRTLLTLTSDVEEPAYHVSLLKGVGHVFRPATEDTAAEMKAEAWDVVHALSERLALPHTEVRISVMQCLQRFWDKGQGAMEARKKMEALSLRSKRFQQEVIKELNKALEQAAREEKAPVATRRPSLVDRAGSGAGRRASVSSNAGLTLKRAQGSFGTDAGSRPLFTVESFMALDHEAFTHEREAVMDRFQDWYTASKELAEVKARCAFLDSIDQSIATQLQQLTESPDPTLSDDATMLLNDWLHAEEKRRSNSNWKGAGMAAMLGGGLMARTASSEEPDAGAPGVERAASTFARRQGSTGTATPGNSSALSRGLSSDAGNASADRSASAASGIGRRRSSVTGGI